MSPSRLTRSLAAGAVLAGATLGLSALPPAGAAPTAAGDAALGWLADELAAADGLFTYDAGFGDFEDYGLTLDAVLALALGGTGTSAVDEAMAVLDASGSDYVTGGTPQDRYAGAIAKALLARQLTGTSTTMDGLDLEAELRARVQPAPPTGSADPGAVEGRLRDASTFGDFSNGFTQALGVLALERTADGVPAATLGYLLDQQCPNGGFRTVLDVDADFDGVADPESTPGCEGDGEAEPDVTALALQALLAVPASAEVTAARSAAVTYLAANPGTNANSLGLAGQALRGAGSTAEADAAADAVAALQFASGAIAQDAAAFGAGEAASTPQALWRSTAQGVLALGLPTFGVDDPPPTTTTVDGTTTTSSTTSTTAAPSSTSSTVASDGTTSTVAGRGGALPRAGSPARAQALLALALVGLGLTARGQSMVRERRRT